MLYTSQSILFISISFCFVSLIKADKTYELHLNKYLIASAETRYGTLKQDLETGEDWYSFSKDINNNTKVAVEMDITWENGYKFVDVYICIKEKMDLWKELARELFFAGFTGHKCPVPKGMEIKLKNSFTVEAKLKEDISGTVLVTLNVDYGNTFVRPIRYDLIGTAKAK